MRVPENQQGLIFRENEKLQTEDAERVLKYGGKFDKFIYWNYDRNPTENDAYKKSQHYMKVAEAVSE
jgi:ribonuclease H2 subunit C